MDKHHIISLHISLVSLQEYSQGVQKMQASFCIAKLGYNKQLLSKSCPQQLKLLSYITVFDYDTTYMGKYLKESFWWSICKAFLLFINLRICNVQLIGIFFYTFQKLQRRKLKKTKPVNPSPKIQKESYGQVIHLILLSFIL